MVAAFAAAACAASGTAGGGVEVVASLYPLAFVAREVAGGRAQVSDLTPAGAEPHDLELTPRQVAAVAEADLVVLLGGGFQPAVEDAVPGRTGADVLEAAGSPADPHVWLDPVLLATVVDEVGDRLAATDPGGAGGYGRRARAFSARLRALHRDYADRLRGCDTRSFVTSHAAFTHLADRYDLDQIAISGTDPEAEPTPRRVAEVAAAARTAGVEVVLTEPLVHAGAAEAVAAEIGGRTAVLDPIENEPRDGDYFTAMRSNLDTLADALRCG